MITSSQVLIDKCFASLHQTWEPISFFVPFQFPFGYVSIQENSLSYSRSDSSAQQWPDSEDKVRIHAGEESWNNLNANLFTSCHHQVLSTSIIYNFCNINLEKYPFCTQK